jgi:cyclic pyranopterin phosphate synthase
VLTHIDQNNNPSMVNIESKVPTKRMAVAKTIIQLPERCRSYIGHNEINTKKGPVFQTAIIAATMAVKKTYDVIPMCHQLPIEDCKVMISIDEKLQITIKCSVKTVAKTGVEMEALHGASIAALTIYDMCKAISSEIIIGETRLIKKLGGKKPFLGRKTHAVILTGGKSKRMEGHDKALLAYHDGVPQAAYLYSLLEPFCSEVYLSAKKNQWNGTALDKFPTINDSAEMQGPMAGMHAAFKSQPDVNWLVVACDLPFINKACIDHLFWNFNDEKIATCYKNAQHDFPEALCAIYTPSAFEIIRKSYFDGVTCPVKVLKNNFAELIEIPNEVNLSNINFKYEWEKIQHEIN